MELYTDFLEKLKEWQDVLVEKKKGSLTHSYMIICKDAVLSNIFSRHLCALMLCGDSGICGKCDTCLKVLADSHPDVFLYPKDETIKKDDIGDIREHINYKPFEANSKIFLLDKFSTANDVSQNKLLKSLENPPVNTYFVLCVDNEIPVLPTIFSRCKKIYLPTLSADLVAEFLNSKGVKYGKDIPYMAEGRLDKALNFVENSLYMQNYDFVLELLSTLNKSSTMLPLSSKLYQKANYLEDILDILESMLADIMYIRLDKKDLVINKNIFTKLQTIAENYSADAVDLIIKKIYETRKQIDFNCTRASLIDNLLLYMLEVKYLCK